MMEVVRVVIISPIEAPSVEKIKALSDRVKVDYIADLIVAAYKGNKQAKEDLVPLLARAEVIYGDINRLPENIMAKAPGLKWIQAVSAGVDKLPEDIVRTPVQVTTVKGVHAHVLGEFALHLMLCLAKETALCFQMKGEKKWKRFRPATLQGKTLGIVGLGNIGRETARLAKAFGMRVVAIRRAAKGPARMRYVDNLRPREELLHLLAESDFVVLSLPLTAETRGMFGEPELRAMKPEAYLINIARGSIVQEDVLIRALEEKWIAGAGLDVFAAEPLAPESRLWDLPNVVFSPHIAGIMPDYDRRTSEIFLENLRRYLEGKKLRNVMDKKKGY